jgi:hypothetical protein
MAESGAKVKTKVMTNSTKATTMTIPESATKRDFKFVSIWYVPATLVPNRHVN